MEGSRVKSSEMPDAIPGMRDPFGGDRPGSMEIVARTVLCAGIHQHGPRRLFAGRFALAGILISGCPCADDVPLLNVGRAPIEGHTTNPTRSPRGPRERGG